MTGDETGLHIYAVHWNTPLGEINVFDGANIAWVGRTPSGLRCSTINLGNVRRERGRTYNHTHASVWRITANYGLPGERDISG